MGHGSASSSSGSAGAGAGGSRALLLTGEGVSALATVRLTGPLVSTFLARHFRGGAPTGGMSYGRLLDSEAGPRSDQGLGERVLDDPVVYHAGEVAEIHLHGGRWIVQRVMELAAEAGFEVVRPLPLPLPPEAVDADSQLAAEILQWLPLAKTREAAASLLAQEALWRGLPPEEARLRETLAEESLGWLLRGPRVAIVGVPNAGKSTLANALLARGRSIAADSAGTTRDWVEEEANLDGLPVRLIDTPGVRQGETAVEREAIRLAGPVIEAADLVVLLLDPAQPEHAGQRALMERFPRALRVTGKSDAAATWRPEGGVRVSARTGEGLDELRAAIRAAFGCASLPLRRAAVWTPRQRQIIAGDGDARARIAAVVGDARVVPV